MFCTLLHPAALPCLALPVLLLWRCCCVCVRRAAAQVVAPDTPSVAPVLPFYTEEEPAVCILATGQDAAGLTPFSQGIGFKLHLTVPETVPPFLSPLLHVQLLMFHAGWGMKGCGWASVASQVWCVVFWCSVVTLPPHTTSVLAMH